MIHCILTRVTNCSVSWFTYITIIFVTGFFADLKKCFKSRGYFTKTLFSIVRLQSRYYYHILYLKIALLIAYKKTENMTEHSDVHLLLYDTFLYEKKQF